MKFEIFDPIKDFAYTLMRLGIIDDDERFDLTGRLVAHHARHG